MYGPACKKRSKIQLKTTDAENNKIYLHCHSCFSELLEAILYFLLLCYLGLIHFSIQGVLPILIKIQHAIEIKLRLESIVEEGDYAKVSCANSISDLEFPPPSK